MSSPLVSGALAGLRRTRSSIHLADNLRGVASHGFVLCVSTALLIAGVASSVASVSLREPVVSCEWLHSNIGDPNVKVLDASWYMPIEQRNSVQEYKMGHIPGALFFDIDGISDRNSDLPHMLPSEEGFAAAVSALGIDNKDTVIVYDGKGYYSAPRVWWMFRAFGHDKVWVLDGGMPQWRTLGYEVESSASSDAILRANEAVEKVYQGHPVGPATFEAKLQPHLIWTFEQISQNIDNQSHQHVDARVKPRFDGVVPEPRKGIRAGHIPGSKCIPFVEMVDDSQLLLPSSELLKRFDQEGISLERPIVVSCASGVTACIVALGLHRVGVYNVPVYDGSWTEWASEPDTPIATASFLELFEQFT